MTMANVTLNGRFMLALACRRLMALAFIYLLSRPRVCDVSIVVISFRCFRTERFPDLANGPDHDHWNDTSRRNGGRLGFERWRFFLGRSD